MGKGLPKKYAKMGFKKGWAAYKRSKNRRTTPRRRSSTKTKRVTTMARRRRNYKKSYRRRSSSGKKLDYVAIGGAVIAEGFVDSLIERFAGNMGLPTNLLQLGLYYYLSKKGGMIGRISKILLIVNAYQVAKGFIGGGLNLAGIGATQTQEIVIV